jgi:hypothetical protein
MTRSSRSAIAVAVLLLLLLVLLHLAGAAKDAERRALLDFKVAINVDLTRVLRTWMPSRDPCAFVRVTCAPASSAVQCLRIAGQILLMRGHERAPRRRRAGHGGAWQWCAARQPGGGGDLRGVRRGWTPWIEIERKERGDEMKKKMMTWASHVSMWRVER